MEFTYRHQSVVGGVVLGVIEGAKVLRSEIAASYAKMLMERGDHPEATRYGRLAVSGYGWLLLS
jgi:hypothetical protein